MKKLFYLFSSFSSNRLFTSLLSILAAAIVMFAVAIDAQAQRTRTGGASGTGSDWSATIRLFDEDVRINTTSVCGTDFFDANATTREGQTIDCTYNGNPTRCEIEVFCTCYKVGSCDAKGKNTFGTRISQITCPTADADGNALNAAGCTGSVTVIALDGTILRGVGGIDGDAIPIGSSLVDLDTRTECNTAFPNSLELRRGVIGSITQTCEKNVPFSADDAVIKQVVRGPVTPVTGDNYFSSTSWFDEFPATCNPADGYPAHACLNDGGAWVTVLESPVTPEQCVAAAASLSCGQIQTVDINNNPILAPGPAPEQCRLNSSNQCECRCARCVPEGSLVNRGLGDQGKFVLSSQSVPPLWAAACDVTVSGN